MRRLPRVKSAPAWPRKLGVFSIVLAGIFAVMPAGASEPEVAVTGCVVDFGGKRYKNVDVTLKGLNYRGGDGYSNNNSVTLTDANGEFSLRMKAGEAPPGQAATAQVRATIERPFQSRSWSGNASDASHEINVSNIGKPVDLRPAGCLRYPWPISVGGEITSEELDEKADSSVSVMFAAGGSRDRLAVRIPNRRGREGVARFDLLVSLSERDTYAAQITEQPKGAHCEVKAGNAGIAGQAPTEEQAQNYWVTTSLRIHCVRRDIPPEEPRPRLKGNKPLLTVGGPESSSEELDAFSKDWDAMEQALHEVGETMPDWITSRLQTVAGRAAYLQLCGQRLALAQKRKKDESDRAKQEGETDTDATKRGDADLPPGALLRRSGNSATALLQGAIDRAEQEDRNRQERAAREARASAERQRLAAEESKRNSVAASAGSKPNAVNPGTAASGARIDAQVCAVELQELRAALSASRVAERHWIRLLRGENFESIDTFRGISFLGAITDVWQFCSTPACDGPQDRARLLHMVDTMELMVRERRGRGDYDVAFHRFKECIARDLVNQLGRPRRVSP